RRLPALHGSRGSARLVRQRPSAPRLFALGLPDPSARDGLARDRARGRHAVDRARLSPRGMGTDPHRGGHHRRAGAARFPVPAMRRTAALILGGGPAGAAAAIRLAEQGLRPLVIERNRETGDALCGGFLSWRTLESLARLGV